VSKRITISVSEKMHLYKDTTDGTIYLELEDVGDCAFELWTNEQGTTSRALVKISKEDFEKMVNDYQSQEN
jgi:hypothetical protein